MELCRASSPPWVHLNADWFLCLQSQTSRNPFSSTRSLNQKAFVSPLLIFLSHFASPASSASRRAAPRWLQHLLSPPELLHHAGNAFSACPISLRIEISTLEKLIQRAATAMWVVTHLGFAFTDIMGLNDLPARDIDPRHSLSHCGLTRHRSTQTLLEIVFFFFLCVFFSAAVTKLIQVSLRETQPDAAGAPVLSKAANNHFPPSSALPLSWSPT